MKRKYGTAAGSRRVRRKLYSVRRKKRSYKRKYLRGRSGFAKAVKNVILRTAEKKFITKDLSDGYVWTGAALTGATYDTYGQMAVGHNQPFQINMIVNNAPNGAKHLMPPQGVTDQTRNGDEIYATGIRLRIQIENDANKHNNTWRFWLVEWNSTQGDPGNPTQLFFNTIGNPLLDTIQHDRWGKVRCLGTYRTTARDVAVDAKTNIFIKKWIPFKRKLCFKDDSTIAVTKGMKESLAIVGVCYDSSNTLFSAALGNLRIDGTFYFKDP